MLLRSAGVCFAMLLLATLAIAPVRVQKTITKLTLDHQQKLDAANRQIDALKTTVAGLQKTLGDLQATQVKIAEDLKKKQDAPPPKDAAK
jgi:uncharacterized protein YoxC